MLLKGTRIQGIGAETSSGKFTNLGSSRETSVLLKGTRVQGIGAETSSGKFTNLGRSRETSVLLKGTRMQGIDNCSSCYLGIII